MARSNLWRRAAAHRMRFRIPVVGITGSSGKTTTKDMVASILARRGPVLKSNGNMNMPGPVRRTLLQLRRRHWAAVLEIAAARPGQVAQSCRMARPTIGVITNVGLAHSVLLGSLLHIAREKGALVRVLPGSGVAFLNADDPGVRLVDLSRFNGRVVWYGLTPQADILASDVRYEGRGMAFTAHQDGEAVPLWIPAPGEHNVSNALAAFGVSKALGLDEASIRAGLATFPRMRSRLQVTQVFHGLTLIQDGYNANPLSMAAALQVLRSMGTGRKVAVLGRMGSLGRYTKEAHVRLGEWLAAAGIDEAVLVGSQARNVALGVRRARGLLKLAVVPTSRSAADYLRETIAPPAVVLFKGSHKANIGLAYRLLLSALGERLQEHPASSLPPPLAGCGATA